MLQRIQTVWLLAASACGLLSLKASFFIGSISTEAASNFTGMNDLLIMILTIIAATVAFIAIFFYMTSGLYGRNKLATPNGISFNWISVVLLRLLYKCVNNNKPACLITGYAANGFADVT